MENKWAIHNVCIILLMFSVFSLMIPFSQTASAQVSDGTVDSFQKISDTVGGLTGALDDADQFGRDVENIGDLDGDGVNDLAVGVMSDDDGGTGRGAVYILFMNSDGTVKSEQKISDTAGGFTGTLVFQDLFGSSVANLGDPDGAGPIALALAVGAMGDGPGSGGGFGSGAVYILFLNSAGIVQSHFKIVNGVTNFGSPLGAGDHFGRAVANIGDLDGDGVTDLAVGAEFDDEPFDSGTVYIIFLNSNGTVKSVKKLANGLNGVPGGTFGQQDGVGVSLTSMGDLDGAGTSVLALAVGANGAPFTTLQNQGQVHILFLNSDGTIIPAKSKLIGSGGLGGFGGTFGAVSFSMVENIGDLNGDGVTDLAVGAPSDADGGGPRGAVWIVFMKIDGTVKSEQKISDTAGNFGGILDNGDNFGFNIANMGDLDGDGVTDLAVGAIGDDDGPGPSRGAVWILFLNKIDVFSDPVCTAPPSNLVSWWPLDETSGTTANDIVDTNPGTYVGSPTQVPGKVGGALSFDPTDGGIDFVQVPNNVNLEPTDITVDAWVKSDASQGKSKYLVSKGGNACNAASYALYTGGDGGLLFYVADVPLFFASPDAGVGIWDGQWHHVAGTYDGSFVRLYVDGNEVGSGTPTGGISIGYNLPDTNDLSIGEYIGICPTTPTAFKGEIDEVEIFDRALSQTEIQDIFDADSEGKCKGCSSGFWKNDASKNTEVNWPTGTTGADKFEGIFGPIDTLKVKGTGDGTDPTLEEALNAKGGKINALARELTAALLNIRGGLAYPIDETALKALFAAVDQSSNAEIETLRAQLFGLNHSICPF